MGKAFQIALIIVAICSFCVNTSNDLGLYDPFDLFLMEHEAVRSSLAKISTAFTGPRNEENVWAAKPEAYEMANFLISHHNAEDRFLIKKITELGLTALQGTQVAFKGRHNDINVPMAKLLPQFKDAAELSNSYPKIAPKMLEFVDKVREILQREDDAYYLNPRSKVPWVKQAQVVRDIVFDPVNERIRPELLKDNLPYAFPRLRHESKLRYVRAIIGSVRGNEYMEKIIAAIAKLMTRTELQRFVAELDPALLGLLPPL